MNIVTQRKEEYARAVEQEICAANTWLAAVMKRQYCMASELLVSPELASARADGRLLAIAIDSGIYHVVVWLVTNAPELLKLAVERAYDTGNIELSRIIPNANGYSNSPITTWLEDGMAHDTTDIGVVDYA